MAINSYRATGAGGYGVIAGAPVVYDKGESIRDLLAAAVGRRRPSIPRNTPRTGWRIVPAAAEQQVRALSAPPPSRGPAPRACGLVLLRVISMNDLHGALYPRRPHLVQGPARSAASP